MKLLDFLFNVFTKQKGNENIKSFDTKLLFRGSEHQFSAKTFHNYCDNKGPTITVIQNEYDYIFGGYVTKSWTSNYDDGDVFDDNEFAYITVIDPTAFLFTIKPEMAHIPFKPGTQKTAFEIIPHQGPIFGAGWDIFLSWMDSLVLKVVHHHIHFNLNLLK